MGHHQQMIEPVLSLSMANLGFYLCTPKSSAEFNAYYDLRWRLLRKPWGQALGSEKDGNETNAFHILVCSLDGQAKGVGRIHFVTPQQGQIRYMAIEPTLRNNGLGTKILLRLENYAKSKNIESIIINARENAVGFYRKHGYDIYAEGETLFEHIKHYKMLKHIRL